VLMKKSLIICIPSLRLGGAAKIALNLCEYYVANGTIVTLILTDASPSEKVFSDIPAGITIQRLKRPNAGKLLNLIYKAFALASSFRRIKPDVILSVRHDATVPASLAWKLAGKHAAFFIRDINPITRTLNRNRYMVRLIKHAYSSADGVISNSADVRYALLQKEWVNPGRIFQIDNPVLTKTFFDKVGEPIKENWFKGVQVPLVLTIGRLQKMKDHETLIRAFKEVVKVIDCRLLIIGEGEEMARLEGLINSLELTEVVQLAGAIENPYPYLKLADVFVLTSIYEGFGNVLVEALSLGKKIVATDCPGGPAYILNQGEFGTLVPVRAVSRIADAILNSLNQDTDEKKLIKRAHNFSVDVVGQAYTKVMFGGH
jgi:glycosyltransferase involved in cell wall biosynthesis